MSRKGRKTFRKRSRIRKHTTSYLHADIDLHILFRRVFPKTLENSCYLIFEVHDTERLRSNVSSFFFVFTQVMSSRQVEAQKEEK